MAIEVEWAVSWFIAPEIAEYSLYGLHLVICHKVAFIAANDSSISLVARAVRQVFYIELVASPSAVILPIKNCYFIVNTHIPVDYLITL